MNILFVGNCQVQSLSPCAQAMLPDARVKGICAGDPLLETERDTDIVFVQTEAAAGIAAQFPDATIIAIPTFCYWGFHPDLVYAFADRLPLQSAMGSYNSALALYGWLNDLSPSATAGLFCDAVYQHLGYYDYTAASRQYLLDGGSRCGVDTAGMIEAWSEHGCFTYTINHPKMVVSGSIARAALQRAGLALDITYPEDFLYDLFGDWEVWPVYPEIGARLGVAGDYRFQTAHDLVGIEEFIERSFGLYATVPREKIAIDRFVQQRDLYRSLETLVPTQRRRPRSNPYSQLPDYRFWQRSVSSVEPAELDPVVKPKFRVDPDDGIATAGSCFAQHIARTLIQRQYNYLVTEPAPAGLTAAAAAARGYGLFSARFGNVYSARQLLQLMQRAYDEFPPVDTAWRRDDGRFVDPFRPQLEPDGHRGADDVAAARTGHFAAVRGMFENADLFVFTVGLTEAWAAKADGAVFPVAPGVISPDINARDYHFINFSVAQMIADIDEFIGKLRAVNGTVRLIFTVSPVPLVATYENQHVLVSTTYSKSAIRAAVGEVADKYDFVDYFPSYEIIAGVYSKGKYFEKDLRSVTEEGVARVMRIFGKHYLEAPRQPLGAVAARPQRPATAVAASGPGLRLSEIANAARIICDEELLVQEEPGSGMSRAATEAAAEPEWRPDPALAPPQPEINSDQTRAERLRGEPPQADRALKMTLRELYAIAAKSRADVTALRELHANESEARDALAARIGIEMSEALAREGATRDAQIVQGLQALRDVLSAQAAARDALSDMVGGAIAGLHEAIAQQSAQQNAARDRLAASTRQELMALREGLAQDRAALARAEAAIAARLDTMQDTLGELTERVRTWLLPTLEEHGAAIARQARPFAGLRNLAPRRPRDKKPK